MSPILLYNYISELNVELNILDYIEIIGWIVVCIEMTFVSLYFFKLKKQNERALYVGLFFILFVGARVCRIIARFYIGESTEGGAIVLGDSPTLLMLQILYNMQSYVGLFFLYYVLEGGIITKTHHFFCFMVIVTIGLSFIQYVVDIFYIILPVFVIILLGIPAIFFNLARKTSAVVRRNALLVAIGTLLFEIGIIIDIPEAWQFWQLLQGINLILRIIAPIIQIIGIYMIMKGFPKEY